MSAPQRMGPLHDAAKLGHNDVVRLLAQRGAPLDARDKKVPLVARSGDCLTRWPVSGRLATAILDDCRQRRALRAALRNGCAPLRPWRAHLP